MEQKLLRRFGKNTSRYFPSKLNNKTMRAESMFEINGMYFLEFDDSVAQYQSQPSSFVYEDDGKEKRYTPDFLIVKHTGEYQFIELKPYKFTQNNSFLHKHGRLNDYFLTRYNTPLTLWTEKDFFDPILNINHRRFYCYRNYDFSRYNMDKVYEVISPCKTVGEVYEKCEQFDSTKAMAPALFANRLVNVDFYSEFKFSNSVEVIQNV
jgi:hypothetical protein